MAGANIVLFGFMASGKTTVGGIISKMNGMPLVDTDVMVEAESGKTVEELFALRGERVFRELEREEIRKAAGLREVVIAVGGGAVLEAGNVARLKKSGVMYLLDVSPGEVLDRTSARGGRPLLSELESEVEELMMARRGAYLEAADVVVGTSGRTPLEVAGEIMKDYDSRPESGGSKRWR